MRAILPTNDHLENVGRLQRLPFSATDDLALDDAGLARFALIARRVGQLQRI